MVTNRPAGDRFINRQSDDKSAKVAVKKGKKWASIKLTNGKRTYTIRGEGIETDSFSGMGQTVPDKIQEFFNLNSINVQEQLDQHYLILDTPGEVAKQINAIAHIGEVDLYIASLTSKINVANKERKFHEDNIVKKNQELLEYKNYDAAKKMFDKIEKMNVKDDNLADEQEELTNIIEEYRKLLKEMKEDKEVLENVESIVEHLGEVCEAHKELGRVSDLVQSFIDLTVEYDKALMFKVKVEPLISIVESMKITNSLVIKKEEELKKEVMDFINTRDSIKIQQLSLDEKIETFKEKLLKERVCPTCHSKLTKDVVEGML